MKALIVDDTRLARQELQFLLKNHKEVEVIGEAENADEAKQKIEELKPDLVFLDIQMPDKDGFQLLEMLDEVPITIFTTAFDEYAIKSFEYNALDYLLKPIDAKELIAAVNKLSQQPIVNQKPNTHKKVALPTAQGYVLSSPEEIIRCQADGAYTRVLYTDKSLLVSRNIGYVEKLLSPHHFFRVHKSHLVNLQHVVEYIRGKGGFAVMRDHTEIEISKRKREDFLLAISA